WIGYRLVQDGAIDRSFAPAASLQEAVKTIVAADVAMSFDNMLAVGGAAHGTVALLVVGLALSMPLILFGSGTVASVLDRLPWSVWVGVVVLALTGARMVVDDPWLARSLAGTTRLGLLLGLASVACALAVVRRRWSQVGLHRQRCTPSGAVTADREETGCTADAFPTAGTSERRSRT
ncbi:MAG: hypothetical protein NZL87_02370, partial [Thermomicrobium sp.]|nr:hypothetical protein [Thermomicrobium sp.]